MEARDTKLIDTGGRDGMPAPEFMGGRAMEAPVGQAGLHGRSSGTPTAGTPGNDIRIRVSYSPAEWGVVQVVGEGPHTGQAWKIARDEKILLKANGGAGGAGGRGEDGQAGGRGRDGRDATKHRAGEDGGDGAPGGNGGYGSNGADGAPGGNVFITVHEEDTDMLLPLEYNVNGGAGGISGQHGESGDGGIGGRGGAPHAWTERHADYVSAHTQPGGTNGRNGSPGSKPSTFLTGGRSGPNGSIQIKVIRGDLSEATYPSVYNLQVTYFDICDENEDSINEPGEHIRVHNIRVKNVGGMPSPELRSIKMLIQGTPFLDPIISEPIELPRAIQPGQEVEVPGVLRSYIRNETSERPIGVPFKIQESVRLVGYFDERLNRPLPNFCGNTHILIQYPLVLDPPTYLDCVAKGDTVRFRWVLHNNSTKAYGIDAALKRAAATKLSDPNKFFTLSYATAENPDEALDALSEIEPQSMVTIDQDFSVNPITMEYSEGNLSLELMLSDPKTGKLRSVQKYLMHMQISGKYQLSPNPNFLLVVNSKTPNHAIHQIIHLVRNRLHTTLDIFNLSLTGSFDSPVTGHTVLDSYEGKSIIIFGNKFPYFNKGLCNPWDILDAWQTGLLLKSNTNILFAAVESLPQLNEWVEKAVFHVYDFTPSPMSINGTDAKSVIVELKKTDPTNLTSGVVAHRFPVKKSMLKSVTSSIDSAAISAAKRLNRNMPLRRFIAVPDLETPAAPGKAGGIIISEGIHRTANLIASIDPFPFSPTGPFITDYHLFFIVSSLPFSTRARMFWNMVGHSTNGLSCDIVYADLESFYDKKPGQDFSLDKKILEAISLSLQFNMTNEIYRFTASRPRYPEPLTADEQLHQLPLFTQFFALAPSNPTISDITNAQLLVWTVGAVHALSNPLNAWQSVKNAFAFCGNRKGRVTPRLNQLIFNAIISSCAPNVVSPAKEHILQRSKQVKAGIRAAKGHKRFAEFGRTEVSTFAGTTGCMIIDLTEICPESIALDMRALDSRLKQWLVGRQQVTAWESEAKTVLNTMVNPVDE